MSVAKLLACMLAIHLLVLLPDTLYPYVHSVHNNRSLEPKFRVGGHHFLGTRALVQGVQKIGRVLVTFLEVD